MVPSIARCAGEEPLGKKNAIALRAGEASCPAGLGPRPGEARVQAAEGARGQGAKGPRGQGAKGPVCTPRPQP